MSHNPVKIICKAVNQVVAKVLSLNIVVICHSIVIIETDIIEQGLQVRPVLHLSDARPDLSSTFLTVIDCTCLSEIHAMKNSTC
jgi:hypothetical protein